MVASRSGNVKDVNDPTFSDWTEQVEIIEPIQLRCPLGRFCQYKLILETEDGSKTPLIREVAVASTIPKPGSQGRVNRRRPLEQFGQRRNLQDQL